MTSWQQQQLHLPFCIIPGRLIQQPSNDPSSCGLSADGQQGKDIT